MKNRVLDSLERFQDAVVLMPAGNDSVNATPPVFAFRTFAIQIQPIDPDTFQGQTFTVDLGSVEESMNITGNIPEESLRTSDKAGTTTKRETASIELPKDLLNDLSLCSSSNSSSSSNQNRFSFSVFLSDILFQNPEQSHLELGSVIVAARASCANSTTKLRTPIQVAFRFNKEVDLYRR